MELNITHIIRGESLDDFSCSQAERPGYAGPGSWAASMGVAMRLLPASCVFNNPGAIDRKAPVSEDEFDDAIVEWLKPWGAWDDEEIQAMGVEGRRALLLQFISGDVRESEVDDDPDSDDVWNDYEARATDGQCSSSLFRFKPDGSDEWVFCFSMQH